MPGEWRSSTYGERSLLPGIGDERDLVIGAFLPSSTNLHAAGGDIRFDDNLMPAINLALEDIAAHTCVLKV
jgi:hypothetical protein